MACDQDTKANFGHGCAGELIGRLSADLPFLSLHKASRTACYLSSGWINLCDGSRKVRVNKAIEFLLTHEFGDYCEVILTSAVGTPRKPLLFSGKARTTPLVLRWHWHRRGDPLELLARKNAPSVGGELLDEARCVARQGVARIPEHATPGP